MRRIVLALAAVLLAGGARGAAAQEWQVALDGEGRVEVIDETLARRLGLFVDEYPGFEEARLFQAGDSSHVLEVYVRRDGRRVRYRRPLTTAEVATLRAQVTSRAVERAPRLGMNQQGRNRLLGQTSLLGLGFYGPALPYVLGTDDETATIGLYMVTAGASFFAPFFSTQDVPVTYGMANLSAYGATRGVAHGMLLYGLVAGEGHDENVRIIYEGDPGVPYDDVVYYEEDDGEERARVGVGLLASVLEGMGGYYWARNEAMSPGTSVTIGYGGDMGLLWGAGTAVLVGTDNITTRSASAITLAGGVAGIVAGRELARVRGYTSGDAGVLYTGSALGAFTGLAVATVANLDAEPGVWALTMAGSAAGALLSDRLVAGRDFGVGQSSILGLGTLAGGLTGLGLAALTEAESEEFLVGASAVGAGLGFAATYGLLEREASFQRGETSSSVRVRLSPAALAARSLLRGESGAASRAAFPLATVEYRF